MHIAAIAGRRPGERRSPLTPKSVEKLVAAGHAVTVEKEIGDAAGFSDDAFRSAGAEVGTPGQVDLLVTIEPPEAGRIGQASAVLGFLEPLDDPEHLQTLADAGGSLYCFELVPRVTRAQTIDALTSQANLAGYQAVLEAAAACDRIFPMLTTAAGTLRPAGVLVLGAGVAGLQAIATARRLGAVVTAFDVRSAASEQVESLGARFITLDLEAQDERSAGGYARELEEDAEERLLRGLHDHVVQADAVITTAAIPGRPAPRLVTEEMVRAMRSGSVIIDGAASTGGNCEVSRPGETVVHEGVTVAAPLDLPSRCANHASQLFARNVTSFIELVTGDDATFTPDPDDEVVTGATAARSGEVVHDRVRQALESKGR